MQKQTNPKPLGVSMAKLVLVVVLILVACISTFLIILEYRHKSGINSSTKIEVKENILNEIAPQKALKVAEEYLKTPTSVPVSTTEKSIKSIYGEHYIKKITISTIEWPPKSERFEIMNSDISLCSLLDNNYWSAYCASEFRNKTWEFNCIRADAIQAGDESLCKEITLELVKKECNEKECINNKGQDCYDLCIKQFFPEKRDECYKDLAIIKKDDSICYSIDESNYYDCFQCVEFAKYPKVENGAEVYEITFLYRRCDLLHSYLGLFGCGGDGSFRIFVSKEGKVVFSDILPQVKLNISQPTVPGDKSVIKETAKNLEKCAEIDNLYGHKDECYADVAVDKQDSAICLEIQEPIYRNWCSNTIEKKYISPEETVCGFFHWYLRPKSGESLEERADVTEEYKRKIAQIFREMTGPGYNPIIFAQNTPNRFITGREEQIERTASVIVNLEFDVYPHLLKVNLLFIDDQWKINDITLAE